MKTKRIHIIMDIFFCGIIIAIFLVGFFYYRRPAEVEKKQYDFTILEKDAEISALYAESGLVYVGTNSGVHIYDASTKEIVKTIDDISMVYTAGMIGDGNGGIWIGHENGLLHVDRDMQQVNYEYPQIPKGRVNTVAACGDSIYCGTYNGAARLEPVGGEWQVTEQLSSETGLVCDSVNVILPVETGILFFSYLDVNGGITYLAEDGSYQKITTEDGLPHPYITSAVEDENGDIWVGTGYMRDGGLLKLLRTVDGYALGEAYSTEDDIPGEKVRYLYLDENTFWITTEYDGVLIKFRETGKAWNTLDSMTLKQENGLSDNEIKCIVGTREDYWLGGKYGLTIVPKEITELRSNEE